MKAATCRLLRSTRRNDTPRSGRDADSAPSHYTPRPSSRNGNPSARYGHLSAGEAFPYQRQTCLLAPAGGMMKVRSAPEAGEPN
ncbi:hypothetical protein CALVIDRAFT_435929 [Calocera viscosa TUFC12733]|uniref:Uncharacterized protein n=1 Tax=Calocera viscosa (strain TUFC12733) TaxID=1330018 RepID=A0A167FWH3_CALVF|nr:hypothetical protein CALVIDRAFT_435929 [Calocera viscosa TUFC12733]